MVPYSIGFIGVGTIGLPIAQRILESFPGLMVFDNRNVPDALLVRGARLASSPAQMADECDVIFGCVHPLEAYRAITVGNEGLINGSRVQQYVHIGTTGPALVAEIADALHARGIGTLDAPMTGGLPAARSGRMTVMVSGDAKVIASMDAVLRCYASKVVQIGSRPGDAQVLKLINNMITAANLAIGAEALVLGVKAGLDPRTLLEVVNSGSAASDATSRKIPNHVLTRTFDFGATLGIVEKDLTLCLEIADELRVPMWVGTAVRQLYMHALAEGDVDDDLTSIVLPLERWAGVLIPVTPA